MAEVCGLRVLLVLLTYLLTEVRFERLLSNRQTTSRLRLSDAAVCSLPQRRGVSSAGSSVRLRLLRLQHQHQLQRLQQCN